MSPRPLLDTDPAETRRIAELLCNCARSRGRHSTYCPTHTTAPRLGAALASHRQHTLAEPDDGVVPIEPALLERLERMVIDSIGIAPVSVESLVAIAVEAFLDGADEAR